MATDAVERAGLQAGLAGGRKRKTSYEAGLPVGRQRRQPGRRAGRRPGRPLRARSERCADDPNVDAIIVVLTPQIMTQIDRDRPGRRRSLPTQRQADPDGLYGRTDDRSRRRRSCAAHGLPNYPVPERAVNALAAMVRQQQWQERPHAADRALRRRSRGGGPGVSTASQGRWPAGDRRRRGARGPWTAYGIRIPKVVPGQDRRRGRRSCRRDRLSRW